MFKGFKAVALVVAALFVFGCAGTYTRSAGVYQAPDGSTFDTQATQSGDAWGIDGKTMVVYHTYSAFDPNTKKFVVKTDLVTGFSGFHDGLGKEVVAGLIPAAVQAAGIVGAGYLIHPSNTNVNAGNNSGNQAQFQGQQQQQHQRLTIPNNR